MIFADYCGTYTLAVFCACMAMGVFLGAKIVLVKKREKGFFSPLGNYYAGLLFTASLSGPVVAEMLIDYDELREET